MDLVMEYFKPGFWKTKALCCPELMYSECWNFWPALIKDNKTKELAMDVAIKNIEDKIKINVINYKLSKKTKKLSAFQLIFSHGVTGTLMKAKEETEDEMQNFIITKKQ
jgi:hypothetical protein